MTDAVEEVDDPGRGEWVVDDIWQGRADDPPDHRESGPCPEECGRDQMRRKEHYP